MKALSAALVLACALVLTGCAAPGADTGGDAGTVVGGNEGPFRGTNVDPPFALPTTTFTDTDGRRTTIEDASDAPATVVIFAYTNCPDVCNAQLAALAAALRRTPELSDQVGVVMISTDPERDDGPAMRAYLDGFGDGFVGLRAPLAATQEAGEPLGVFIERGEDLGDGGYEVDHTAALFGFDEEGRGVVLWQPGTPVADLEADLTTLVETR
jgi:protein SCO1/2